MTHRPTDELREKVMRYAKAGIPQIDIAKVLKISKMTLRKHYGEEMDAAIAETDANVGGALYTKAMGGDTTAMIWWTKARMRWKETRKEEHRYVDGEGNDLHKKDFELLEKHGIDVGHSDKVH